MEKIKVSICIGTACYVMGASELLLLEEQLSPELKDKVEIEGIACLDLCKYYDSSLAPFVRVNDEVLQKASVLSVIDKIREMAAKNA